MRIAFTCALLLSLIMIILLTSEHHGRLPVAMVDWHGQPKFDMPAPAGHWTLQARPLFAKAW